MQTIHDKFLTSAFASDSNVFSTKDAVEWVSERTNKIKVQIKKINLSDMDGWYEDRIDGRVRHKTGKFFSIDGIRVRTSVGPVREWSQPIINQPEIGFLGCIVKDFGGVLHFLVQAKIEPGNVNVVQLSPTLQATRSNYMQEHKGRVPKYLEYFNNKTNSEVLIDQLQSEQGARFLNKRNRNIIVLTENDIPPDDNFRWLTLGQIKILCEIDNLVNMDLRTVISGIPFDGCSKDSLDLWSYIFKSNNQYMFDMLVSAIDKKRSLHKFDTIISWLTELKSKNDLFVSPISLHELDQWFFTDQKITHKEGLYFDVEWVSVSIENREIAKWDQPIVSPRQHGLIVFIIKKIKGVYHFLVQAKVECGNFDIFELAPTVQCITGSYDSTIDSVPFLRYVLAAKMNNIRFDTFQSEEGGRFYHEQNRTMIVECFDDIDIDVPENYIWMTYNQLLKFIKFNNFLNIQARSLLSCIRFS